MNPATEEYSNIDDTVNMLYQQNSFEHIPLNKECDFELEVEDEKIENDKTLFMEWWSAQLYPQGVNNPFDHRTISNKLFTKYYDTMISYPFRDNENKKKTKKTMNKVDRKHWFQKVDIKLFQAISLQAFERLCISAFPTFYSFDFVNWTVDLSSRSVISSSSVSLLNKSQNFLMNDTFSDADLRDKPSHIIYLSEILKRSGKQDKQQEGPTCNESGCSDCDIKVNEEDYSMEINIIKSIEVLFTSIYHLQLISAFNKKYKNRAIAYLKGTTQSSASSSPLLSSSVSPSMLLSAINYHRETTKDYHQLSVRRTTFEYIHILYT
jgi:hypothetical protein